MQDRAWVLLLKYRGGSPNPNKYIKLSMETFSKKDHPLHLSHKGKTGFSFMKDEWLGHKEMSEQKQSLYFAAVFSDDK